MKKAEMLKLLNNKPNMPVDRPECIARSSYAASSSVTHRPIVPILECLR